MITGFTRALLAVLLLVQLPASAAQNAEVFKFFREYVGLHEDQITQIQNGKAVAKIVDSNSPDDVFVFGSVYVRSTPEEYLKFAVNTDELRKLPSYLALRKFSDPPQLSDLEGFTLDPDDIKQLKNCEPGKCEVQLPSEAMAEFKQSVNWSAPDTADQVNRLAQKMAFQSLLSRSKALPVYLAELDRYLLDYPKASSEDIQSEFYWEKVNFGLKPTLRMVQAMVYRGP